METKRTIIKNNRRSRRPLIFVINYILYSIAIGFISCWWYVSRYGGAMPPSGSFDDFIADSWGKLTTGFAAPIILAVVMNYVSAKRKRSAE